MLEPFQAADKWKDSADSSSLAQIPGSGCRRATHRVSKQILDPALLRNPV